MAHNNLFNYGLGYYGGGNMAQNCGTDMNGCCSSPGGPSVNLTYVGAPTTGLSLLSNQQKVAMFATKTRQNVMAGLPTRVSPVEKAVPKFATGVW